MNIIECDLNENENEISKLLLEHDQANGHMNLQKGNCSFRLVNENGEMVGGISAKIDAEELHICLLAVSQTFQSKGGGKKLLEACEDFAKEKGCKIVTVSTRSYQAPKFYKENGYTVFAELVDVPVKNVTKYFLFKKI